MCSSFCMREIWLSGWKKRIGKGMLTTFAIAYVGSAFFVGAIDVKRIVKGFQADKQVTVAYATKDDQEYYFDVFIPSRTVSGYDANKDGKVDTIIEYESGMAGARIWCPGIYNEFKRGDVSFEGLERLLLEAPFKKSEMRIITPQRSWVTPISQEVKSDTLWKYEGCRNGWYEKWW
jgi:hypothetical protein